MGCSMTEADIKCLFDVAGVKHTLRENADLTYRGYDVVLTTKDRRVIYHNEYFITPAEAYKEAWLEYERHVGI